MLPWRTGSTLPRPELPLPPGPMPMLGGRRPLKRWHYIGCFTDEVMLCAATARIGPLPISWWAVWDRGQRTLAEHTARGRPVVDFRPDGRVCVDDGPVRIDILVEPAEGVETISPHGAEYIWTRKQGGVAMRGQVAIGDRHHQIDGRGVVDESAGYHDRHTSWKWSAGVGVAATGEEIAWNLVSGMHDAREASERTLWVDGSAREVAPVRFVGLDAIRSEEGDVLEFTAEATRAQEDNLFLFASSYEQPFGSFSGSIAGVELREGLGVMERHDVTW